MKVILDGRGEELGGSVLFVKMTRVFGGPEPSYNKCTQVW